MAAQSMEVEVDATSRSSSVKRSNKRTAIETSNHRAWGEDEVRDVADVVRGGQRVKGDDGEPQGQRDDPELVELLARCFVRKAAFNILKEERARQRQEFNEELRSHGLPGLNNKRSPHLE
ncbi:hypothetical protein ACP70R_029572 [Stipagrostis hirtigluma subsp. patula]